VATRAVLGSRSMGSTYSKQRTLLRACGGVLVMVFLVAVGGWLYLRHPRFSGKEPTSITIFAQVTNTGVVLIDTTITNRESCSTIFAMLRKGTWGLDPKCEAIGRLTIQYVGGTKDELGFLPSHADDKFEFRHRWLKYNVAREKFYQTLTTAGIEVAKIPEKGHQGR
jgi:hypothetical protein